MIKWFSKKKLSSTEQALKDVETIFNKILKEYNEELTERAARVALAIQASGQEEVHEDFQWILSLVPIFIREAK